MLKRKRSQEPHVPVGQFRLVMKRFRRNRAAVAGLVIFCILVLLSVLAPYIVPYDIEAIDTKNAYKAPSFEHLFGTDNRGRDIFSRLIYGGRYSLTIGIMATAFSIFFGLIVGSISGFFGGKVDNVIMRCCDVIQSIPGIVLDLALSCVLGAGFLNCIIALGIGGIAGYARMIRASILQVRKMEYIDAAIATNCRTPRIIFQHALPNAISPIIVQGTMGVAGTIMAAASLSYLGMGVQPPAPEWGAMLTAGRNYISKYPYMTLIPGLVIVITVLSLNLLGDGLRDAMDPKQKR